MNPSDPHFILTEEGPTIELGLSLAALGKLTPAERMRAVSTTPAPPPAPRTPVLRPVFVTAPTVAELIARGQLATEDASATGAAVEAWKPRRRTDVREHLLHRLGFIADPDTNETAGTKEDATTTTEEDAAGGHTTHPLAPLAAVQRRAALLRRLFPDLHPTTTEQESTE